MSDLTVALLALAGTLLTVGGGLAVAAIKWWPRISELWDRLDEQDDKIEELQSKVKTLEQQAQEDKDIRHGLKNALVYVVSIANSAIAQIIERFDDDQIATLPEPLRSHVRDQIAGRHPFEDHLDLTRPRRTD